MDPPANKKGHNRTEIRRLADRRNWEYSQTSSLFTLISHAEQIVVPVQRFGATLVLEPRTLRTLNPPGDEDGVSPMRKRRVSTCFAATIVVGLSLVGCSHAVFPQSGGTGNNNTSTMIFTLHDAPPTTPSGVTVTSFEVTVSGVTLQPGNISLLTSPQTVELTQLQTNSVFLQTTQVPTGTYTGITITYASPQYTFLNNSGSSVTVNGQACAANASCVVATPTVDSLTGTATFSSSISVVQGTTSLVEADVNLNSIIQTGFDLDFSKSAGATVTSVSTSSPAPPINVTGQITSIGSSTFQITPARGPALTITTDSGTTFEFARNNCSANNFSCLASGQIVDATVEIQSDGATLDAVQVDFDDAPNTQQVSGTVVIQNGTPPTSVVLVVHNTIPPVSTLPVGSAVTVTIGGSASYVINNGSFVLPTGLSFASTSDILVGQEIEARVASNSSISNAAFTTDRLALEQTQVEAVVSTVYPQVAPFPYFLLSPLPPIFSAAPVNQASQLEIVDTSANGSQGTLYQGFTPDNIGALTTGSSQYVAVGGFLFNTNGSVGSPSIIATIVRQPM